MVTPGASGTNKQGIGAGAPHDESVGGRALSENGGALSTHVRGGQRYERALA